MTLNKFKKAYDLVGIDIGCPRSCKICEKYLPLIFLPWEIDFLSKKLKVSKTTLARKHKFGDRIVWMIGAREPDCKYYKCRMCQIRVTRPFDCRSFPVVPYKSNRKISVKLDPVCPLVKRNKIKKAFVNRALKAWRLINPPDWWLDIYKKENKL